MSATGNLSQNLEYLLRPLETGQPLTYWQLGETDQQFYDTPDAPINGEMDPVFFLTKHKNFIPHQYPCRTAFIASRRAKKPQPLGEFTPHKNWLPFGSARVDLSGFWFRPTVLGTWARTIVRTEHAGTARFELATCGGAILIVNKAEAGWIGQYERNLETKESFSVDLNAGDNEILVYFDDLAERDARYYFELTYMEGPRVKQGLPVACAGQVAGEIEAALEQMRFEKTAYQAGEVALVTPAPISADYAVSIEIEGDFMSRERMSIKGNLKQGSTRISIGQTEDLPADFRHFKVSLQTGGFAASRIFGVEICHARRQGPAPVRLMERVDEALDEVSEFGEQDSVCALARLATGRAGKKTDQMILAALPSIVECHDCADFTLVPLLWCRAAYAGDIAPDVIEEIDAAILKFRFWMDEPGNDVQWYFSENHALLFHTAAYLAGHLLPEEKFERSGRSGVEQAETGARRVRGWLSHFEKWEMAEFNSAPYFPIDLKGLTILFALAPDDDIRRRAGLAIGRIIEIIARSAHHGALTGAQGRSYEHTLCAGRSLELSGIARMLWGNGNYGRRFHVLPQLGLCLLDHGLELPEKLTKIALYDRNDAQEWCFAQGEQRFARLYHYKTRDFAMGSAAAYRWNEWGYQETVLHLRLGKNPDAQIWINHPGETIYSGFGRPSYWGGSGTLPRVHQYRGLAVLVFDCHFEQPGFTHAWFPLEVFDESKIDGRHAFARCGNGLVMLKGTSELKRIETGPGANAELVQSGRRSTWIIRLGDTERAGTLEKFADKVSVLKVVMDADGVIGIDDPEYGAVLCFPDGRIKAEGRELIPRNWSIAGRVEHLLLAAPLTLTNGHEAPQKSVRPLTATGEASPI